MTAARERRPLKLSIPPLRDIIVRMIGKFSRHVLLTGAGWSRNWGGQLANEVWSSLVGHPRIRANAGLRDLLLDETAFEVALGKTHVAPFTAADRAEIEQAVLDIFVAIDREIARPDHEPWINIYKVQELLFRFFGQRNEGNSSGYLFTLNQDLFFERHLYNEHVAGAPGGVLPGLVPNPGRRWFWTNIGAYDPTFMMQPAVDPRVQGRLANQMNVIKLYGSFNWRSPDGGNAMVVGTEKTAEIASMPLLSWYADIFRAVINAGDVRLMIAGYGFADEHINAAIADAVEHHRLSLFIWNTTSDVKSLVLSSPHGARIWQGLISTATRPLIEVFPSNQAETEEYRRIRATFFS
ncbi:SIR2 family protein [Aurantimonas marianensis]|uniref:SIR2 family protein n=1 Tax=Aurantimonas marianensis TaxID=2920428 RepID=A0A9X2HC65_9HYPH|nr:SIR2 family protein [Aurantimonas marianensis]